MIKTDDISLGLLNMLIAVNEDAQRGYETAASDMPDAELARTLGGLAVQRMEFADELADRVRVLRATPVRGGTLAGAVHRAWMDLRAANSPALVHAILSECERADDLAVKAYIKALQTPDVDSQTHDLIQRQYERVQLAHDQIRQFRDRLG